MKRVLIPLASYLAVTIVVPILNGAPIDAPFIEHAALTIIITGTLSALRAPRSSEGRERSSDWVVTATRQSSVGQSKGSTPR